MSNQQILIINGPNLNLLGLRETHLYGKMRLDQIQSYTEDRISQSYPLLNLTWFQSNSEAEIVQQLHLAASGGYMAVIINPAAYSHTSITIMDAMRILSCPCIEVHLSHVFSREAWRKRLLTGQAASSIMSGLGYKVYYLAVLSALESLNKEYK